MPLEGLKFVRTEATFGTIYTTDPLLQNTANIVCPVDSPLINPCRPYACRITCANVSKSRTRTSLSDDDGETEDDALLNLYVYFQL